MAIVLAAHEQEDPLNYSVSVASGIAYGNEELWGTVDSLLQRHMPLNDLVCHRHAGRILVDSLHVRLSLFAKTPAGPPNRPAFQYARPYVHVFLVDAATVTTYTQTFRETLQDWVTGHQEAHNEWIILYAPEKNKAELAAANAASGASAVPSRPPPSSSRKGSSWSWLGLGNGGSAGADPHAEAVAAASSNRDAVWARICKDFGNSPKLALGCHTSSYDRSRRKEMAVQPLPRLARLSEPSSTGSPASIQSEWRALKHALETCIMCCLDARLTSLEKQVKASVGVSTSPGWDFMSLFLLRECLAFVYSAVRLPEHALLQYRELQRVFGETAHAQAPYIPLPPTLTSHLPGAVALPKLRTPRRLTAQASSSEQTSSPGRRSAWGGMWPFKGDKRGDTGAASPLPPQKPAAASVPASASSRSPSNLPVPVQPPTQYAAFAPPGPHHGGMFAPPSATAPWDDGGLIFPGVDTSQSAPGCATGSSIREAQTVLSVYFNVYSAHGLKDEPVVAPPAPTWGGLPQCPRRHLFDASLKDKPYRERISAKTISSLDFWRYCLARQGSLMKRTKQTVELAARSLHYLKYMSAVTQLHLAQARVRPVDAAAWVFCSAVDAVEVTNKDLNGVRMPQLQLDDAGTLQGAEVEYSELDAQLQALTSSVFSVREQEGLSAAPAAGYSSMAGSAVAQLAPPSPGDLIGHTDRSSAQKTHLSLVLAELIVLARSALALAVAEVLTCPQAQPPPTSTVPDATSKSATVPPPPEPVRSASARTLLAALRDDLGASRGATGAAGGVLQPGHSSRILMLKLTVMGIGHLSAAGHGHSAAQLLLEASALWVAQGGYMRALPLLANQLPLLATHNWRSVHLATLVLTARAELGISVWRRALCSLWRLLSILTPLVNALQGAAALDKGAFTPVPADELEAVFRHSELSAGRSPLGPMEVFGGGVLRVWRDLLHICCQLHSSCLQSGVADEAVLQALAAAPKSRSQSDHPLAADAIRGLWGGVAALSALIAGNSAPPFPLHGKTEHLEHPEQPSVSLSSVVTVAARPLLRTAVCIAPEQGNKLGLHDVHGGSGAHVQVAVRLAGGARCAPGPKATAAGSAMGVPVHGIMVHLKRIRAPAAASFIHSSSPLAGACSEAAPAAAAAAAASTGALEGVSWAHSSHLPSGAVAFSALFDAELGTEHSQAATESWRPAWTDSSGGVCSASISQDAVLLSVQLASAGGLKPQLLPGGTSVFSFSVPAGVLSGGAWDLRSVRVLSGMQLPAGDGAAPGEAGALFGCSFLDQFPTVLHAASGRDGPQVGRWCSPAEALSGACSLRNGDCLTEAFFLQAAASTNALPLFRVQQGSAMLPQVGSAAVHTAATHSTLFEFSGQSQPSTTAQPEVQLWHTAQVSAEEGARRRASRHLRGAVSKAGRPRRGQLALQCIACVMDDVFAPPPSQIDAAGTGCGTHEALSTARRPSWLHLVYSGHSDALSSTLALAPRRPPHAAQGGLGGASLESARGFAHSFAATPTATPMQFKQPRVLQLPGGATPQGGVSPLVGGGATDRCDSALQGGDGSASEGSSASLDVTSTLDSMPAFASHLLACAFREFTGVALPLPLHSGGGAGDAGGIFGAAPSIDTRQMGPPSGIDQLVRVWAGPWATPPCAPSPQHNGHFMQGAPFFVFSSAPAASKGTDVISAKWSTCDPAECGNFKLSLKLELPSIAVETKEHLPAQWLLLHLPHDVYLVPHGVLVDHGDPKEQPSFTQLTPGAWVLPLPRVTGAVQVSVGCWVSSSSMQGSAMAPLSAAVLRAPCPTGTEDTARDHCDRHVWSAGVVGGVDTTPPQPFMGLTLRPAACKMAQLSAEAVRCMVVSGGGAWDGEGLASVVTLQLRAMKHLQVTSVSLGVNDESVDTVALLHRWECAASGVQGGAIGGWRDDVEEGVQGVLLGGCEPLQGALQVGDSVQVAWAVPPALLHRLVVVATVAALGKGGHDTQMLLTHIAKD